MNKLKYYLPTIAVSLASIITAILYILLKDNYIIGNIFIIVSAIPVSLIIPIFSLIIKKEIPISLNVMLTILAYVALSLGTGIRMYDFVSCWDTICHTYFGFFICFYFYFIFGRLINYKNRALYLIVCFFFISTIAILWEFIEFTFDFITGDDSQKVQESLDNGHAGTFDTMIDILVAYLGYLVYLILYLIDFKKFKLHNFLCKKDFFLF